MFINGTKVKILSAKQPVACRLIRSGTEGIYVKQHTLSGFRFFLTCHVIDIYKRGMSSEYMLKRALIPEVSTIKGCRRQHVKLCEHISNPYVDDVYQLVACMRSTFDTHMGTMKYARKTIDNYLNGANINIAALPQTLLCDSTTKAHKLFIDILAQSTDARTVAVIDAICRSQNEAKSVLRDKSMLSILNSKFDVINSAFIETRARMFSLKPRYINEIGSVAINRSYFKSEIFCSKFCTKK